MKKVKIVFVVLALIFSFASVIEVEAAAAARFDVSCSRVTMFITGATPGMSYDLLVSIQATGFIGYLPAAPVDSNGNLTLFIEFPTVPDGTLIYADTWQYNPIIVSFALVSATCGFGGSPIPSGFVLAQINCDVTVFQMPNPDFPTSARLRNGQTWFVNPESVTADTPSFTEWTEVFVGGPRNGYIPTSCVQVVGGPRR